VRERLGKRVENTLVEIGVFAGDFQGDVFAAEFRDVANDPRKSAEELFDGNHADFEDALVKFVEDARLECQGLGELAADWIAGVVDVELGERAVKHGLADDQFTDEIHDRVDARGVDTERAFGNSGNRRRAIALIGRRRTGVFGGARGNLRGLGFQKITEEFVFGSLGVFRGFDANFGDDCGNLQR